MPTHLSLDSWLEWQQAQHPAEIELGLERVGAVYRQLGERRPAPLVITVAGTNGKGSCIAILSAMLRAHGLRVGAYTSPHLQRYNERIQVDGVCVEDAKLIDAFERIENARQGTDLTFFEYGTLAAFVILADAQVDVALLEVGLGGRLDAVNLVDADVVIITGIDFDHQDWLGDSLEEIAREKAGVMRRHRPVVYGGRQRPRAIDVAAGTLGAELIALGKDFDYREDASSWSWRYGRLELNDLPLPQIAGRHQTQNAAACIVAVHHLTHAAIPGESAIASGLNSARLAGRLQRIATAPEVILDVAHNRQSVEALANYLRKNPISGRTLGVFGALKDKQPAVLAALLAADIDAWYVAPPASARAMGATQLVQAVRGAVAEGACQGFDSVTAAYAAAMQAAEPDDRLIIFGSFFTVEEVLTGTFSNEHK